MTPDAAAHSLEPLLRVQEVCRAFGELRAVEGVSFEVRPGEIVGLLGPNGAGKTTCLRMIATLLTPDSGTLTVAGHDVARHPLAARARLGYQTGETGLYGRLTPREFLRYFGRLHELPDDRLEPRIAELVASFEMADFADRPCRTLSTGQKQRVSLARALLHEPSVVVLDEPTSGLDIVSSRFVLDALREARAAGRAVLFSTHILSEIELVCDRVLVMHRGRLIARGTVAELLEQSGAPPGASFAHAFLALLERYEDTSS